MEPKATPATYHGYARKSTDAQDLSTQVDYLRVRADQHGMVFKPYEESSSAKNYNRQIPDIIAAMKPGDILGFYMTSRLGRPDPGDEYILLGWAQEAQKKGCNVEISGQVLDTRNMVDALRLFLELMQAGQDWANIKRNTKRGREGKRRNGDYLAPGGIAPHGMNRVPGTRKHVIDAEKAEVVRTVFRLFVEGRNANQIALYLIKHRIPSPRGIPWTQSSVLSIVNNPLYMGRVYHEEIPQQELRKKVRNADPAWFLPANNYPPIVSEETFFAAQRARSEYKPKAMGGRAENYGSLYTGRFHCWYCWKEARRRVPLTFAHLVGKSSDVEVYRTIGCPHTNVSKSFRAHYFDTIGWASLGFVFVSQLETDLFIEDRIRAIRSEDNRDQVASLETQAAEIREEILTWEANIERATNAIMVAKWLDIVAGLQTKELDLKRQMTELQSDDKEKVVADLRQRFAWDNYARFKTGDKAEKKAILSGLLESGWIVGKSLVWRFRHGKTVVWDYPQGVPDYRNQPTVLGFHVLFDGREQYRGRINAFNGDIIDLEIPNWIQSDGVREEAQVAVLAEANWLERQLSGRYTPVKPERIVAVIDAKPL